MTAPWTTSRPVMAALAVVGAAVLTALTVATAAAVPTPMGGRGTEPSRLGASPSQAPRASSPPPGFLLERGRFKPVAIPRGLEDLVPFGINDQGQVAGAAVTAMTASGFLRDPRGRLTAINRPGVIVTVAADINNRGQIVGFAVNPEDLASPPPANTAPMGRKA
jgi:hypothetical protein